MQWQQILFANLLKPQGHDEPQDVPMEVEHAGESDDDWEDEERVGLLTFPPGEEGFFQSHAGGEAVLHDILGGMTNLCIILTIFTVLHASLISPVSTLIHTHRKITSSNRWMHGSAKPPFWQQHTFSGSASEIQYPRLVVKNLGLLMLCHSTVYMLFLWYFTLLIFFFHMQILPPANLATQLRFCIQTRLFFYTVFLAQHQRNPHFRSPWSFLRFIGNCLRVPIGIRCMFVHLVYTRLMMSPLWSSVFLGQWMGIIPSSSLTALFTLAPHEQI